MPRLLSKLIQRIKASNDEGVTNLPRKLGSAFRHTRRIIPIALPPPSLSPRARKHSILLDDVNPITNRDAYVRHKTDAPIVPSVAARGRHANTKRHVREMTDRECQLWSDPYLRMLSSPLRQCLVTQKYLPSDFMLRVSVLQVKGPRSSKPVIALLPDGVEHPRFRRRNSGRGYYLTTRKVIVEEMCSRSSFKRIPVPRVQIHSLLVEQIAYQLRLRILQEIELMTESLRCSPQTSLENTVIRRLTRAEWAEIKSSGRISQPGAVAVLVVPPLNNRKRSEGSDENIGKRFSSLPPVSVLYRAQDVLENSLSHPTPHVPLYNGLALFPSRPMRLRLYMALQKALLAERKARWRQAFLYRSEGQAPKIRSEKSTRNKASHAYLLCSNGSTIRRADSVPLAIALWRVRMWEGQGWEDERGEYDGWEAGEDNLSES